METVNTVLNEAKDVLLKTGRAALHALAPDNFEYYMCSLELIDSSGVTKGFLYFVLMPNNITETETPIVSVTKTHKGVVTLFNPTFVPKDISLQGTFGRKVRLLLGMKDVQDVSSIPFFRGTLLSFDNSDILIKTGYGLIKMLQRMIKASHELDDKGKPFILLFRNYALNTHYVVEVLQHSYSQSLDNNMLWNYSLEMKAIAPAESVSTGSSKNGKLVTTILSGAIANSLDVMLKNVTKELL